MPYPVPTPADLDALATRFRMQLTDEERTGYAALVAAAATAYDRVEQLYQEHADPGPTGRSSTAPADNPLGAWYRTCEITDGSTGPLAGRRVAIKDNVAVAGVPIMNGSVTVEGYLPRYDATVVRRLLAAGATIVGKAVCESLCFSGGSHTADTGPVRNPWDRNRSAGGSSAGSAALVASGAVDLALGGDQGGSIRIPSAFCGTVGHKPTFGLVPYTGAFPIERTIDHLGPITATVADAAQMLAVIAGDDDGRDPRQPPGVRGDDYPAQLLRGAEGLRVGVLAEGFGIDGVSDPGVDATVRACLERLAGRGVDVVDVSVSWHSDALAVWNVIATDGAVVQMIEGNGYGFNVGGWYDPELMAHYGRQWRDRADRLSVTTKLVALTGARSVESNYGSVYAMARNLVPTLRAAYDAALAKVDVLVMPTLPIVASPLPGPDADLLTRVARALEMLPNTAPFDVTGHPATSVPAGLYDDLPVGLQIVGRHGADATCLRVAAAVEAAAGGFPRPPT